MTHNLAVPTIHLNGSNKDRLLEALSNAREALRLALDAMRETAPNGRDYYTQKPGAFALAQDQHTDRLVTVTIAHDELTVIAMEINDQTR